MVLAKVCAVLLLWLSLRAVDATEASLKVRDLPDGFVSTESERIDREHATLHASSFRLNRQEERNILNRSGPFFVSSLVATSNTGGPIPETEAAYLLDLFATVTAASFTDPGRTFPGIRIGEDSVWVRHTVTVGDNSVDTITVVFTVNNHWALVKTQGLSGRSSWLDTARFAGIVANRLSAVAPQS